VNLKIAPDESFARVYHLYDDKRPLAVILQALDGNKELAFTVKTLKFNELREVYDFVSNYSGWLTDDQWLM
jgi:hypothetical protein